MVALPIILAACAIGGVSAQCGTLTVPENRAEPAGRQIDLAVAVVPAVDRTRRRADPVFWISGGPGGVARDDLKWVVPTFANGPLQDHDFVFVDQRGVGASHPLSCAAAQETTDPAQIVRQCLGVVQEDVTHYRTTDAMDDLEDVRVALGYERIDVWGGSYGATAAQVFVRRHPTSVRTAVVESGSLLDVPVFERWASSGQRALNLLHKRCHADRACAEAFPRWYERFPALLAKLARKPAVVGKTTVDAAYVAGGVDELTTSMNGAAGVPLLLAKAEGGSLRELVRVLSTLPAGGSQVTYAAIVCTEPWARHDVAAVRADAAGTYLRYSHPQWALSVSAVCSAWPPLDVSQEDWTRLRSAAETLVLVGAADPKDPPANVAGVTAAMPNARVVTVPGGGHGVSHVGCLPRVVAEFLDAGTGRNLDTSCVSLTPYPPFRLR